MWGEIVKNPNTHVMCPLLVYSKISNWMVKFFKLPCTFSMVLRIQYKKFLFLTTKSISERVYCEVRSKIPNILNRLLHETVLLYPIMILNIFFCILTLKCILNDTLCKIIFNRMCCLKVYNFYTSALNLLRSIKYLWIRGHSSNIFRYKFNIFKEKNKLLLTRFYNLQSY